MNSFIKINDNDNIAVALKPLRIGEVVHIGDQNITIVEEIPAGHKVALCDIEKGKPVVKYGFSIGNAIVDIKTGQWIHTHNIKTGLGEVLNYTYNPIECGVEKSEDVYFYGFNRENGKVGVRNEVWIIPTVGCVNNIVQAISKKSEEYVKGSVECTVAFTHPYGCSQIGADQENTRKILSNLINHPNAGGVLVCGLGCENSNIDVLKQYIGNYNSERVKFLVCQDSDDEIYEGVELVKSLINYASQFEREQINANKLIVGLKCGGSDGFSGITANPLVGKFSDILISKGGTTILTEVPEMFGAETLLMDRCIDSTVFDKTVSLINDFKNYFKTYNQPIYENPSPGNKKGGISTLEDKSLGCTQKSGNTNVKDVIAYGNTVKQKGLNLLNSPGNDLVAATALAAAGAHIILFTTGRGTPFSSPVPTIKISSNSTLATKKHSWIDFDAGILLADIPMNELSNIFFNFVIKIASGQKVKSEEAGYHNMAIFK